MELTLASWSWVLFIGGLLTIMMVFVFMVLYVLLKEAFRKSRN